MPKQKIFKDFFDKIIKIDDEVLHLWCVINNGRVYGGEKAVQHKIGKIINLNTKTVRMEWLDQNGEYHQSSIKNTKNRIIVLDTDKRLINSYKYHIEINSRDMLIHKLHKKVSALEGSLKDSWKIREEHIQTISGQIDTINKLQNTINELTKDFERFAILDLRR